MEYGNPATTAAVSRAADCVQDILERDVCVCGGLRRDHANGQGIQPAFIRTDCNHCPCRRFRLADAEAESWSAT